MKKITILVLVVGIIGSLICFLSIPAKYVLPLDPRVQLKVTPTPHYINPLDKSAWTYDLVISPSKLELNCKDFTEDELDRELDFLKKFGQMCYVYGSPSEDTTAFRFLKVYWRVKQKHNHILFRPTRSKQKSITISLDENGFPVQIDGKTLSIEDQLLLRSQHPVQ